MPTPPIKSPKPLVWTLRSEAQPDGPPKNLAQDGPQKPVGRPALRRLLELLIAHAKRKLRRQIN
jgi:hypothetical protein